MRLPPEWGVDPVPPESRRLRGFDFFVLWFSLGVGLLVMAAGTLLTSAGLAPGLPPLELGEALLVIVIGSVVGSVMLASAGLIGSRYGVPSMVSLRAVLGRKGSYGPTLLNVVQLVGWAAFEVMVMGEAAARLAGQGAGSWLHIALVPVFGAFCAFLAIGGPLVVIRQWLEKFAVWLIIASTGWITYLVFTQEVAWGGFGSGPAALLLGLDLVIAMPVSWWPLVSDYNRFGQRRSGAFAGTATGYALANAWFFFLGAAMIVVLQATDVLSSILVLNLGVVALFLLLVDETDNGFANVYSSAVSLQNIFPRMRQRVLVALITAIAVVGGVGLAAVGGLTGAGAIAYESFLLIIGGVFVPLLGVLVADYLLVRRGVYSHEEFYGERVQLRARAILAWAAGAFVYFFLYLSLRFGWSSVSIGSSLPSFVVALLAQVLIALFADRTNCASKHRESAVRRA